MGARTPEEIFGHHAAALMKGDIDEIVADYADDAVFVAPDRVLRGKAGIREAFETLLGARARRDLGRPGRRVCRRPADDRVERPLRPNDLTDGVDTFVFRDGTDPRPDRPLHRAPALSGSIGMAGSPTFIASVQRALNLVDAVGASGRPVSAKVLPALHRPEPFHHVPPAAHPGARALPAPGGRRVRARRPHHGAQPADHPRAGRRQGTTVLQALHDELHAPAYLSLFDDGEIHVVDIADSPEAPRVDLWVGFHDAAHACALGRRSRLPRRDRAKDTARHELRT